MKRRSEARRAQAARMLGRAVGIHLDAPVSGPPIKCDCHSYNGDYGTTPEVVLGDLPEAVLKFRPEGIDKVSIDACIVDHVRALWNAGCITLSTCCGHGREVADLVVSETHTPDEIARFAGVLAAIDERCWRISQWQDATATTGPVLFAPGGPLVRVDVTPPPTAPSSTPEADNDR